MLPSPETTNDFACLKLDERILKQLSKLGFQTPTPIQAESIPHALEGQDIIGIAQTGTGKTLAFGLPMLQKLLDIDGTGLVLAPTRELAIQIDEELRKVGHAFGLKTAILIGGAPMNKQIAELRRRPNIIVATPGRLMDHLNQRTATLKFVSMVVLDEADRMFDMGFAPIVRRILDQTPKDRQTMLFSATMAPEVTDVANSYLVNPIRVEIARQGTPAELIDQELHVIEKDQKNEFLGNLLDANQGTILVFSRTRHGARKVARTVRAMGHTAAELHSDRTLAQRRTALQGFKSGEYRVLVATDIAARGIDVKDIELVINYDLPDQIEDYIHRIGRTGRAGSSGRAVTFALPDQYKDVRQIERLLGREIPVMTGTLPVHHVPKHNSRPKPQAGPRPERKPRRDSEPRSFEGRRPQAPRPFENRESRPWQDRGRDDRPQGNNREERPERRPSGDRPAPQPGRPPFKPQGRDFDRGSRPFKRDERPSGRPFNREDRPFQREDRPYNRDERPGGRPFNRDDRPFNRENRPFNREDKPFRGGDRPYGRDERPGGRPFNREDRPFNPGDRPFKPNDRFNRDDRPYQPRENRDERPRWEERRDDGPRPIHSNKPQPPFGGGKPKPYGAKPPFGSKPSGPKSGPKEFGPKPFKKNGR
ncbi:MAG: hypothetical protein BGO01_15615 [Armatimonadetes bacterium 55-13]|nr:DEAD/DEAH box helicase [Armatimonadota bacterium]OJU65290.1 MAG: hypothetical protein BGO01_15615 [Armatimonadetes bacterium 55-13]